MTLATGTKLGPYEIQSALGAGGMGEVYRARDTRLDLIGQLGTMLGNSLFPINSTTLRASAEEASMALQSPSDVVRQVSSLSVLWGVLLVVLGVMAVASPLIAAVAVNVVIAWLIVLAGVVHLIVAFHTREAGSMLWRLLVGLAYIAFGIYLIARPAVGVASLTLVLASLFLIEGVFDIALYFKARVIGGAGWILFDGIISLVLGLMIYLQWPSSSNWAIGTLVGASLIVSGVTRVMVALQIRKAGHSLPMAA